MKRLAAMAIAAVAYVLAAWTVAPGFYDGLAPAAPYRWVSPPPDLRSGNQPPSGGRTNVLVQNGAAQPGHLYTTDQQASIRFPSLSFQAPAGGAALTLEIQPVATYPPLGGITPAGNVYLITVSTRIISPIVITLRYGSQQVGPPTGIFAAETATSAWRTLSSVTSAVPYTLSASTSTLGYFVVGFPPASSTPAPTSSRGGPPVLLLVAAGAAALAVLGGIPLLLTRRRPAADGPEPESPPAPGARPGPGRQQVGSRRRRRRGRR